MTALSTRIFWASDIQTYIAKTSQGKYVNALTLEPYQGKPKKLLAAPSEIDRVVWQLFINKKKRQLLKQILKKP